MANDKIISLKQLKTSITKMREFIDNNYSSIDHKHNDIYYTKDEIDNRVLTSNSITVMDGYVKPEESGAILSTDSLNAAIGKLEKALENASSKGDIQEAKEYTDSKIADLIAEAPEELRTLNDLAKAIQALEKSLQHPTGNGYNHIPSGGMVGQILRNISEGTAEWADIEEAATVLKADNVEVSKILDDIFN